MKIEIKYKDKFIQDVQVGDIIKSFDIETNNIRHNRVGNTILPIVEKYRQCKVVCENGASVVTSTTHPMCYYNIETNKWGYKDTGELIIGDIVKPEFSDKTLVSCIEIGLDEDEQFYDLTVERDNNYFAGDDKDNMIVVHNSATIYFPWWHQEIEDILVLKNNKGTDDNRVRHVDYGIQFSKLFYQRFLSDGDISLFSPHNVPGLYDVFGYNEKFDELYEKYESNKKIIRKTIKARDLMNSFTQERIATGRMYVMNIDTCNTNTPFIDRLATSNLCLTGDNDINSVIVNGKLINEINMLELIDLFQNNKEIQILSKNIDTNELEFKKLEKAWKTKEDVEIYEIEDEESGYKIKCTGCHLIFTTNRGWVEAKDLIETDTLDILK